MDVLQLVNAHIKFSAFDFLTLKPIPPRIHHFFSQGRHLLCAQIMGIVVSNNFKPNRFIKFDIDNGTDCIPYIL
ncbi:hypothetical protein MTR67_032856 [Solanum verrucosum]|uniref:Uncharacterized protein n=1 Tax=Solanum verrucosum TaxID=315347 RepID=A0AAF0U5D2_SOLVR|nr:hypothetical protein MTR67_032856 [Solanum verrucosum]